MQRTSTSGPLLAAPSIASGHSRKGGAMKTLIANGTVITPEAPLEADILFENGQVAAIGKKLPVHGAEVVDARGKLILPGGVDAHTHITLNADEARGSDVFFTGTIPAVMGGTTTILDHMAFAPGRSLHDQYILYRELSEGFAVPDYGFHGVVQVMDAQTIADLSFLSAEGCTSVKAYMTYDFRLSDDELLRLLRKTRELGMLLTVHAEDHERINALRARFISEGKGDPVWHPQSRPAECEASAVSRLLRLAAKAGDAPVYVVHLSTASGLEAVKKARASGQKNVFAETCTQYLVLNEERYREPVQGLRYVMSPPLRTAADVEALWGGIADGSIQAVATDHCSFTVAQKMRGLHDFTRCPGGAPGLEERLTVLFSEGVAKGRISVNRFVEVVSATPAELFGLWPRKGALAPGFDADAVIFDPGMEYILHSSDLHGPGDYSIYEDMSLTGRVESVFLRGKQVACRNEFTAERGCGQYLHRDRDTE